MLILSPSKTLSKRAAPEVQASYPLFLDQSVELVNRVNMLGRNLAKTLGVSREIAELNRSRFEEWSEQEHASGKPAIYAYAGDVYNGLAAFDMSSEQIGHAQQHLRILSGLYGSLRPLDLILPYRLEMSTKLSGKWGSNLYKFWGDQLANSVVGEADGLVLNCASNEYAKAVLPGLSTTTRVITPKFLHDSGDGPRAKMTFAKYTRGLMARWAVENRVSIAEDLLKFDLEGYRYEPELSSPNAPTFIAPKDFSLIGRFIKF